MQDQPSATELLEAVAKFIREHALPQLDQHAAFHARVAANALDIVRREIEFGHASNLEEHKRLLALLKRDGSLEDLNRELSNRIASGEIDLSNPALSKHLWATVLDKLKMDQPGYASYIREQDDEL
jgi:hypothetical protein